jgi:hypothetical protein
MGTFLAGKAAYAGADTAPMTIAHKTRRLTIVFALAVVNNRFITLASLIFG